MDLNTEWMNFIDNNVSSSTLSQEPCSDNITERMDADVGEPENLNVNSPKISKTPKCSELYISTKTMIGYLDRPVNLTDTFWNIPIIPYHLRKEGVIKKQIKFKNP